MTHVDTSSSFTLVVPFKKLRNGAPSEQLAFHWRFHGMARALY